MDPEWREDALVSGIEAAKKALRAMELLMPGVKGLSNPAELQEVHEGFLRLERWLEIYGSRGRL